MPVEILSEISGRIPERVSKGIHGGIPEAIMQDFQTSFFAKFLENPEWNFRRIFGRVISKQCLNSWRTSVEIH